MRTQRWVGGALARPGTVRKAVGSGARGSSDRIQRDRKGQSLVEEVLDLGQEGEAVERDGFGMGTKTGPSHLLQWARRRATSA